MSRISCLPRRLLAGSLAALVLSGCASTAQRDDPLEGFNRAMFSFNEQFDRHLGKPVAQVYEAAVPAPARTAVGNFASNLEDPWIALNNVLQGKFADGLNDLMRFVFNSTLGLFGLIDLASPMGLAKHDEDLGQTLGAWGVGEGAYLVLPFLGPRTLRDAVALPADFIAEQPRIDHVPTRNSYTAFYFVHVRSTLLGAEKVLDESSFDKYAYMRDFYLQQRRYRVADGNLAPDYDDYDDFDDFDDE